MNTQRDGIWRVWSVFSIFFSGVPCPHILKRHCKLDSKYHLFEYSISYFILSHIFLLLKHSSSKIVTIYLHHYKTIHFINNDSFILFIIRNTQSPVSHHVNPKFYSLLLWINQISTCSLIRLQNYKNNF